MSEEDGAKSRDEILDLLLRLEHTLPTDAISNATSNVTISKEQISSKIHLNDAVTMQLMIS